MLNGRGNVTVGFIPIDGPALYCNYCSSIMVSPQNNTCYRLRGENSYGCVSYDDVCVRVIKDWDVYIPNTFTPNGDGVNDKVYVRGFGIAQMNFRIYNRWGQLVFESGSPAYGWDGTFKGVLQPMDVYAYTLIVQYGDGTVVNKKGDITLIR